MTNTIYLIIQAHSCLNVILYTVKPV